MSDALRLSIAEALDDLALARFATGDAGGAWRLIDGSAGLSASEYIENGDRPGSDPSICDYEYRIGYLIACLKQIQTHVHAKKLTASVLRKEIQGVLDEIDDPDW